MIANIITKIARPRPKTSGKPIIPIITPKVIFNILIRPMSCNNHMFYIIMLTKIKHSHNVTIGSNKTLKKD